MDSSLSSSKPRRFRLETPVFFAIALFLSACGPQKPEEVFRDLSLLPSPIELCLVPHEGDQRVDREIQAAQAKVASGRNPVVSLERLGWAYIAKARRSLDSGFYRLAEACADAIALEDPEAAEALLLRGHVLTNLHRFAEAEAVARKLVDGRGIPFDHLLLGDALMEQGKLEEAIESYQTGVDLRPCLQSYARVGWIRWLIGDLPGAIGATKRAVAAGSPQDPDSLCWALTRLATFQFTANDLSGAVQSVEAVLRLSPDYPPARLLQGRMFLARGEAGKAVPILRAAVERNPMPDHDWALAEALHAAGESEKAAEIEDRLTNSGARIDRRTLSLYLATAGTQAELAVELARREMEERQDVFTRDALAWALCAAGRFEEAHKEMDRALDLFPEDGRLFLHAAVIAHRAGQAEEAGDWFDAATEFEHTLLPSERRHLTTLGELLARKTPASVSAEAGISQQTQTNKL